MPENITTTQNQQGAKGVLDPIPICGKGGCFYTNDSLIPGGCLRIQLNSDTIYPEIALDPIG